MSEIFKFKLGSEVEERITGYTGIIMGRSDYLTGCVQYGILSPIFKKDGEPRDWIWYDESRIKLTAAYIRGASIGEQAINYTKESLPNTTEKEIGGPQESCAPNCD